LSPYTRLQILIPVYNDWASVQQLLPLIDGELETAGAVGDVLLANDGSDQLPPESWAFPGRSVRTIRLLRLRRNLGHQRAICVGLCHLRSVAECTRVLIMDGDGEDAPGDIPRLLTAIEMSENVRIVFAERIKRSEGWLFALFYALYRFLHRALVGHRVRVGNFSVMNRECLESLCTSSELWNHFAASAFATRQSMALVKTHRARRLSGKSKMSFAGLVMHGLSALSVFSDRIGTRLLIATSFATVVALGGMIAVIMIRLGTNYAIPGWATTVLGILLLLTVQIATFMFTFCFLILFARGSNPFVPVRDYQHFVANIEEVWHGYDC